MKKTIAALIIAGLAYFSANGQTPQINCEKKQNKVCRASANKKETSCYKTQYAANFKVCKNQYGYFICCETPGNNNTTYSKYPAEANTKVEVVQEQYVPLANKSTAIDMAVPQSQSYVVTSSAS